MNLPPFIVPFMQNPFFVDRKEDLSRLEELLKPGAGEIRSPLGLVGMGGVGKTQLAVQYAYHYQLTYPGGIFWINASQPLQESLVELGAELLKRELDADVTETKQMERQTLVHLRQILAEHYGLAELKILCFDLGVNYEDLAPTLTNMAMELVAYLHRRDRIPELIAAIRQERPGIDLDKDLAIPETSQERSPQELRATIIAYLRRHPDALLILDNVTQPSTLNEPAVDNLVLSALPCPLLFTTRQRNLPRGFRSLEVDVLPEPDALQLLLSRKNRRVLRQGHPQQEIARSICKSLGHLPLALELAAAYLDEYAADVTLEGYLERLRTESKLDTVDEVDLRPQDLPTPSEAAVVATLQSQWDQLQEERDQDARLVFRTAGQLPEGDTIPRAWLGLLTGIPAEAEPGRPSPLARVLFKLHAVSLIEELSGERLRLHPLVHEFAAQVTPRNERNDFRRKLENNAIAALEEPRHQYARALAAGECLLHLEWTAPAMRAAVLDALRQLMQENRIKEEKRRTIARLLTHLRWLDDTNVASQEILDYLEIIGRFVCAATEREFLTNAITAMLSPDLPSQQQAPLLVYRAAMQAQQGKLSKAQADYEKAKELLGEIVESQHSSPKEMKVLARVNLGLGNIKRFEAEDLLNAQDQKQAQKALRQAVQLYLAAAKSAQMFGQDVLLKATIYKELSQAHALLQNWREAEDYCNRALEALAGAQDPEAYVSYYAFTLDAKGNLHRKKAKYLIAQGHHQKALSEYEAAYKIAQKEIAILDGFIGESQDLVIAHINAGEYLSAIQKHRDTKVLKPMSAACQHWQIARDMAQRLGLPHWENEADSHLIRSCPD